MSCSTDTASMKWISPIDVMAFSEKDDKGESGKDVVRRRMVWEGTEKEKEKDEAGKPDEMSMTTTKDGTETKATTTKTTTGASTPKGVVRARVSGIPANCEGVPIQSLCYSGDPDFPALVWCTWVGSSANETNGPYSLQAKKFNTSGIQYFVDCKVPSIEKVAKMTTGSKLDLFLGHGLKDAIRPVPYTGYKGGNAVTVSKAPGGPPAPSAPPSPST